MIGGFTEHIMDEEASASSDAPASISREPLHQELSRKVVSGKHHFFQHTGPKLRSMQANQNYKGAVRRRTGASVPPDGSSRIRAKQKLRRRRNRVYKSFSSRRKSRKSFALTIHWNLANLVKIISWNHRASTPHRSETHGIAERAVQSRIRDMMVADIEELGKLDASEIHAGRLYAKEILTSKKGLKTSFSRSQMERQNCLEEIMKSENQL